MVLSFGKRVTLKSPPLHEGTFPQLKTPESSSHTECPSASALGPLTPQNAQMNWFRTDLNLQEIEKVPTISLMHFTAGLYIKCIDPEALEAGKTVQPVKDPPQKLRTISDVICSFLVPLKHNVRLQIFN